MKLNYYPDTDSLYIRLSERMSIDSRRVITGGVILDYDESGNLVGIDVENASSKLDLSEVQTSNFPIGSSSSAERQIRFPRPKQFFTGTKSFATAGRMDTSRSSG